MRIVQWSIGIIIGGMILTALFAGAIQGGFNNTL